MKKLIALAAIATCGAALAVESANIVGYTTKTIPNAVYTMYGPSFNSVGNDVGMKLKDIGFPATETGDGILLIDPTTAAYTELTYVTAEGAADEGLEDGAGWYNFTGDDPVFANNWELSPGQGVWIYPVNGAVTATASIDM